jgi:hypothetical protein
MGEDHPCSLLVRLIEQGADGGDWRFLDAQNEVDCRFQAGDDGGAGLWRIFQNTDPDML